MAYEKITPAEWIKKLQEGNFKNIASARKSMGKTSWPLAMRARVALLVERHYEGHPLKQGDINRVVDAMTLPESKREPVSTKRRSSKKRSPVAKPESLVSKPVAPVGCTHKEDASAAADVLAAPIRYKGFGTRVEPYEDLRAVIRVAHDALLAYKTVHDIAPSIVMSEELDTCIGMIEACVKALGDRIPKSMKKEAARLQEEAARAKEPKALKAPTLVAHVSEVDPGMPLESNEVGADLWRRTKPSRTPSNGGA